MADSGADGVGGRAMGVNILCIGFHFWNHRSVLEVEGGDDGRNSEYSFKMIRMANCTVYISAQAHTGRHTAVEEKEMARGMRRGRHLKCPSQKNPNIGTR